MSKLRILPENSKAEEIDTYKFTLNEPLYHCAMPKAPIKAYFQFICAGQEISCQNREICFIVRVGAGTEKPAKMAGTPLNWCSIVNFPVPPEPRFWI